MYRVRVHGTYFMFNLYEDANRWMRGADKSKKKRKHDVRAARRAPTYDFVQVTAPHLVRLYARENLPSNRL